ncbi:DUF6792 domain-containing protein [Bacillus sp. FJAT-47783]|uniref:DUF6792 domain-containing protein n=1 Tax=Bacillus sp. FJAT-47783 TaxID=2922712 RepID=UPI001FAE48F3|nr:DUF6792 domain-containing protein [Bacillus sp. FJAT-47783]
MTTESNQEVLNSDILRARMMNSEYKDLTVEEVKKIYIEETGKEPPALIRVYHSDKIEGINEEDYGFDGTVIHFYDEEKGINQTYTITRGSEAPEKDTWKPHDWVYNTFGIFTGQNKTQYEAAKKFDRIVTKIITNDVAKLNPKKNISLKKYGYGHSLGGNLIQTLELTTGVFEKVYVINDAPPNFYQLAYIDEDFRKELVKKFSIDSDKFKQIYTFPPSELKAFAEEYYQEKGQTIYHLTAKEDMLYAASIVRGFMKVGNYQYIDTMDDFDGIRDLLEKIPDQELQKIQVYLTKFSPAYNQGGFNGLMKAMTGIDLDFIEKVQNYNPWEYIANFSSIVKGSVQMIAHMEVRASEFIEILKILHKNIDPILDVFVELGYMKPIEKQKIMQAINGIQKDLNDLENLIKDTMSWKSFLLLSPALYSIAIGDIIQTLKKIKEKQLSIIGQFHLIKENTENLMNAIDKSVSAHGLNTVINSISKKGRRYDNEGNLILTKNVNNQRIEVNLSVAVKIFKKGFSIIEKKQDILNGLKLSYNEQYLDDFENRKRDLYNKIAHIEGNPSSYKHLLGKYAYESEMYSLKKIDVHEEIPPLSEQFKSEFEQMFFHYEQEMAKTKKMILQIKIGIEELFKEEKSLAQLFNLNH